MDKKELVISGEIWSIEEQEITAVKINDEIYYKVGYAPKTTRVRKEYKSNKSGTEGLLSKGTPLGTVENTQIYDIVYNELCKYLFDGHWHLYSEADKIMRKYYYYSYDNIRRIRARYFKYARDFFGFEKTKSEFRFINKILVSSISDDKNNNPPKFLKGA